MMKQVVKLSLILLIALCFLQGCKKPLECKSVNPFAGNDITSNCSTTTVMLGAETLLADEVGAWSIESGLNGTFDDPAKPNALFLGQSGVSYVLRWTVTNGCNSAFDDVEVAFGPNLNVNAGADQTLAVLTTTLNANPLTPGSTGKWIILTGEGGLIESDTNPTSKFTGVAGQAYLLQWTVTNGTCAALDNVSLVFQAPVIPIKLLKIYSQSDVMEPMLETEFQYNANGDMSVKAEYNYQMNDVTFAYDTTINLTYYFYSNAGRIDYTNKIYARNTAVIDSVIIHKNANGSIDTYTDFTISKTDKSVTPYGVVKYTYQADGKLNQTQITPYQQAAMEASVYTYPDASTMVITQGNNIGTYVYFNNITTIDFNFLPGKVVPLEKSFRANTTKSYNVEYVLDGNNMPSTITYVYLGDVYPSHIIKTYIYGH